MIGATQPPAPETSEREALRRRVKQMFAFLNQGLWEKCFALIDPKLRDASKVELSAYAEQLQIFRETYGPIRPWYVRISLHLNASANKRDPRPFAYVYVVWQDDAHGFHMFRERWVKDADRWFTRVLGLVPNRLAAAASSD